MERSLVYSGCPDSAIGDQHESLFPDPTETAAHKEFMLSSNSRCRRLRPRAVLFATLFLILAGALIMRRRLSSPQCFSSGLETDIDSFVGLSEQFSNDLPKESSKHVDVVQDWLSTMNLQGELDSDVDLEQAQTVLGKILGTTDKEHARKVVDKAVNYAVKVTQSKRSHLGKHIKSSFRARPPAVHHKDPQDMVAGEQVGLATCVLDVLSATSTLAQIAADVNDATKTCETVEMKQAVVGQSVHQKVCGLNILASVSAIAGVATFLSVAADDCAATMVPNMNALCASSASGLVLIMSRLGGAGALASASCSPEHSWYGRIPPDLRASEIGSNGVLQERGETPTTREDIGWQWPFHNVPVDEESGGPQRRLLLGGGSGSMTTQCSLDIANTAWGLAFFALTIDSLANDKHGTSCPPRNLQGKENLKGVWYYTMVGYCTVDILGIISFLSQVVGYISLAVWQCADVLSLPTMCAAGIDGIVGALAGIGQAVAGAELACHMYQHPAMKMLVRMGDFADRLTKGKVSTWYGSGMGDTNFAPFARRLSDSEEFKDVREMIGELKTRYASPEAVWASISVNLTDPSAAWRKIQPRLAKIGNIKDLVGKSDKEFLTKSPVDCH